MKDSKVLTEAEVIVHLGAGECEQLETYLAASPKHVMLIDADTDICEKLKARVENTPEVSVYNVLLAVDSGEQTFYRYGLSEFSSILEGDELHALYPNMQLVSSERRAASATAQWLKDHVQFVQSSLLVIDLPGIEQLVLESLEASGVLNSLSTLIVYCNAEALYKSEADPSKIQSLLSKLGFELAHSETDLMDRSALHFNRHPLYQKVFEANASVQAANNEFAQQSELLKTKETHLKKLNTQLESLRNKQTKTLSQKNKEIADLKQTVKKLEEALAQQQKDYQTAYTAKNEQLKQAESKISETQEKLTETQENLVVLESNYAEQTKAAQKELADVQAMVTRLESEKLELSESAQKGLEDAQKELSKVKAEKDEQLKQSQQELKDTQKELSKLKAEKSEQLEQSQQELEDTQKELSKVKAEKDEQLKQFQQELEDTQKELSKVKAEKSEQLEQSQQELIDFRETVTKLQSEREELEASKANELAVLQDKLDQTHSWFVARKSQVEQQELDISELNSELGGKDRELASLTAQLADSNQSLAALTQQLEQQASLESKIEQLFKNQSQEIQQATNVLGRHVTESSIKSAKRVETLLNVQNSLNSPQAALEYGPLNIKPELALFLSDRIKANQYDLVIEFGAGTSTLLMARALQNRATDYQHNARTHYHLMHSDDHKHVAPSDYELPKRLLSFENSRSHAQETSDTLKREGLDQIVDLVSLPLTDMDYQGQEYLFYDCKRKLKQVSHLFEERNVKILIFVDGPTSDGDSHDRYPALPMIMKYFGEHQLDVVLDDYCRSAEKKIFDQWKIDLDKRNIEYRFENKAGALYLKINNEN